MIIGIDIDNTISNTSSAALEYLKKYPELNIDNFEDFNNPLAVEFLNKYIDLIQKKVTLKDHVKESFDRLNENGIKIVLLTARGYRIKYDYQKYTKDLLDNNNIKYDKIVYKSYPKGKDAFKEKIDLFIDDKENNLDDVAKYNIKCIRFSDDKNIKSKYKVFNDWRILTDYIIKEVLNGR